MVDIGTRAKSHVILYTSTQAHFEVSFVVLASKPLVIFQTTLTMSNAGA